MECCISVCHGSLTFTSLRQPKRLRRLHAQARPRITATTTSPEKNQGSARRVSFQVPRRLLETTGSDFRDRGERSEEVPSTSGRVDGWEAEYVVEVTTSDEARAGLSVPDAGVMLSVIGEGGEAVVRRILPVEGEDAASSLRFQRGALDVVRFRGPNVGRISALWVAPEAGTWQLGQVTVTTVPQGESGLRYVFNARDMVLGDGEDTPAAELTPSQVLDYDGAAILLSNEPLKTPQDSAKMREASMREYEALKLFLLSSTAGMVGVGTLGLYLLGAPDVAQGFAAGGAGGLVYLLLIQRAVDQIPGPDQIQARNVKVKTPAASFALFVGVALVVTRASQASTVISLPPQALLAGALGFLTSKVAVFLAAFRSENDPK